MYIDTLVADTYLYQFYFWRDPCSSVKPGVHTVGRSVGRRALLFTVCSLQNAIFTAVAGKKQNCKSCWKKRFSNVSSSLQLHCFRRTMIIDCQKWNVLKVHSPVPYQCDYYMRKCNLSRKRRTNIQFCGMWLLLFWQEVEIRWFSLTAVTWTGRFFLQLNTIAKFKNKRKGEQQQIERKRLSN